MGVAGPGELLLLLLLFVGLRSRQGLLRRCAAPGATFGVRRGQKIGDQVSAQQAWLLLLAWATSHGSVILHSVCFLGDYVVS